MVKAFFKNPITIWTRWFFLSRRLIFINRKKNLKIGYMSSLKNVNFGLYNTFYEHTVIRDSSIGDYVYVGNKTKINRTIIGNFCSIGPNVQIGLGTHPTNLLSTFPAFYSTRKQCQISFTKSDSYNEVGTNMVGNDVWIGANVIIMDNIKIGDGAIIAAGAVVTKNVLPYSIVGGVPAKNIKYRFSQEKIEKLLTQAWWKNDLNWILENIDQFEKPIN